MKSRAIIIDIDNTLLTQTKRKHAIIQSLFCEDVSTTEIEQDFNLGTVLSRIAEKNNLDLAYTKDTFANSFFGESFNLPEYFDCLALSPHYLKLLAIKNKIIYVSARDYRLKEATKQQLEHYGFPVPEDDELYLLPQSQCPNEWTGKHLDNFFEISLNFKKETLNYLKSNFEIIVGIGDSFSDLEAYNSNSILSVMIKASSANIDKQVEEYNKTENKTAKIDKYSYIVLDTWKEIYQYVISLTSENDDLKELCIQHSSDYSKWMYDLDNKSYLILVAATFCITSFISLLNNNVFDPFLIRLILFVGIVASALSMFFAVHAFASRNTHGRAILDSTNTLDHADKKIINKLKNFIFLLAGKQLVYSESIADVLQASTSKDEVNKSEYAKVAYLKYFKDRYKKLDPHEIISKTLFNLRDANYKKILSERYARFFLNITIIIMVVVSAHYIFGNSFTVSHTSSSSIDSNFIAYTGTFERILELDDSCFDNVPLQLSEKGEQMLEMACNNTNAYLICKIVSDETYVNETIEKNYNSIKYELIKAYIADVHHSKDVILIV